MIRELFRLIKDKRNLRMFESLAKHIDNILLAKHEEIAKFLLWERLNIKNLMVLKTIVRHKKEKWLVKTTIKKIDE